MTPEGVTLERFPLRNNGRCGYIVRDHGRAIGVITQALLERPYKTRPSRYHEGFISYDTAGATRVSRRRGFLAGWLLDPRDPWARVPS